MKIEDKILESEELIRWMDKKIAGLEVSSDERAIFSASLFDVALEHQKAIVLLIAKELVGSAFSLARILTEAYHKGVWIRKCASENEIEIFKKDKLKIDFGDLIKDIEQQDGYQAGILSKVKAVNWKAMNSYTHSGFLQVVRRSKEKTIEPDYSEDEILEVLDNANAIGMLSAMQIASMADNYELANELLDKVEMYSKKP
ncbi:MAG: hypothetical protein KKC21_03470 [Nitrospinae bacterium]|nr:hypothetical protein [Nitrospinota bacterium]